MNIIDRFSSHLKDTLARALRLAAELKNPTVEPAHLLYALFNQKGSLAAEILNRLKITPKALENALLDLPLIKTVITGTGQTAEAVLTPFSTASRNALEGALLLAEEHGHNYVGTEHLLTAIIQVDDQKVLNVFKECKVSPEAAAKQIHNTLDNASQFPRLNEMVDTIDKIQDNLNDLGDIVPSPRQSSAKRNDGGHANKKNNQTCPPRHGFGFFCH